MKCPVIHVSFLPMAGMAIFPFIFIKQERYKTDKIFINHEKIHLIQQVELMLIGFYILYLAHYIYNLLKYRNHEKAYFNIIFEKEAYNTEDNLEYLRHRRFCQWTTFM